jgi:hypothetical protein
MSGQAFVVLPPYVETDAAKIPAGAENVKISAEGARDLKLAVANSTGGRVNFMNSSTSTSGEKLGGTTLVYKQVKDSEVSVSVYGRVSDELVVWLSHQEATPVVVTLVYSFDDVVSMTDNSSNVTKCPLEVPFGCAKYNDGETRLTLHYWSTWVKTQYNSSKDAWNDLCTASMEAVSYAPVSTERRLVAAGPLPFYMWKQVWQKWPQAGSSPVDWQATFFLIDGFRVRDRYIEPQELYEAYNFSDVYPSVQYWYEGLKENHTVAADAYEALVGNESLQGISFTRWEKQLWPKANLTAPAAAAFDYVDTNGNDRISKAEFTTAWNSMLHYTITTTTTTYHFCCNRTHAVCLACKDNMTVALYCTKMGAAANVPGCKSLLPPPAMHELPAPIVHGACLQTGVMYFPEMPGSNGSLVDGGTAACQQRCADTPGCFRFSLLEENSSCSLHNSSAQYTEVPDVISGPSVCHADLRVMINGISFPHHRRLQDNTTRPPTSSSTRLGSDLEDVPESLREQMIESFVRNLAITTGLPQASIKDPAGVRSHMEMSEMNGSLQLHSHVQLPAGSTIAGAASLFGEFGVRAAFLSTLAGMNVNLQGRNVSTNEADMLEAINLSVGVSKEEECYIQGTRYEPSLPTSSQAMSDGNTTTKNISDCHLRCMQTDGCAHFTFWPGWNTCRLHDGSAKPVQHPNTTAGPRSCAPIPRGVEEPTQSELETVAHPASPSWFCIVTPGNEQQSCNYPVHVEVLGIIVVLCCFLPVCAFVVHHNCIKDKTRRRGPNSRPEEPDYHRVSTDAEHHVEYQPMSLHGNAAHATVHRDWQPDAEQPLQASPSKLTSGQYAATQRQQPHFIRPEDIGVVTGRYAT